MYPPVCSKSQLKFIWKNDYYRNRIVKYIVKRLESGHGAAERNVDSLMTTMLNNSQPDDAIYSAVFDLVSKLTVSEESSRAIDRSTSIKAIVELAQCHGGTYVDIGAADGTITQMVSKVIEAVTTIATDIIPPPADVVTDLDYRQIVEGKFPIPDKYVDVATAFVVLHHVNDIPLFLREVKRILKPGGVFIIREHNIERITSRVFIDIIHAVSHIIHRQENIADFYKNYFSFCRSAAEWDNIFAKYGFKKICCIHYNVENPQLLYYTAYKRTI